MSLLTEEYIENLRNRDEGSILSSNSISNSSNSPNSSPPIKSSTVSSTTAEPDKGIIPHKYTVVYNSESHLSVLTQKFGSIRPKILPYCIFNCCIMLLLDIISKNQYHSIIAQNIIQILSIGPIGHKFMKFIIAFLIVTRVKMSLDRYMEARNNIGLLYRESRELIQNMIVFTNVQSDTESKIWRQEMSYRTLLLLRTSMAVLNYRVRKELAWQLQEVNGPEKDIIVRNLLINPYNQQYAIDENTELDENMRVPILLSKMLRQTIIQHKTRLIKPLPLPQELKLYSSVDQYMIGYYGLRKFLTTPTPFPLIQMSKTFLFLYVFTIPFMLLQDTTSGLVAHVFFVFLITLGFIGLEVVAMELDNPFGDDPNDFNNLGLAATANEDTYLTVLDVDGKEWADNLRHRMNNNHKYKKRKKQETASSQIPSSAASASASASASSEITRLLPGNNNMAVYR